MKTMKIKLAKAAMMSVVMSMSLTAIYACGTSAAQVERVAMKPIGVQAGPKIQIAILLDTSSSMNGLINQAKSRLWNIINTMTTLKYNGQTPKIEIAIYEYGNSRLNAKDGYILRATPFTSDLDLVSEVLFGLNTGGGEELCGEVIKQSLQQLTWDDNPNSMKLVYIAGNEPFDQIGVNKVAYPQAIELALQKEVYINTIHCGDVQTGINEKWKAGADMGKGKFFNIDQNRSIQYVATPYDDQLEVLNTKLNATYHGYGRQGAVKKAAQVNEDRNARTMDKAVAVERSVSKSKVQYNNSSWDMVDAYNADKEFVQKVDKTTLPDDFKALNNQELEKKLKQVQEDRAKVQQEMEAVSKKRTEFLAQQERNGTASGDDLGNAINSSILELAQKKKYTK